MKKENIPMLTAEILKLIPVAQPDIWKHLNISSKECSTLISIMMKQNIVMRTRVKGIYIVEKFDAAKCQDTLTIQKVETSEIIPETETKLETIPEIETKPETTPEPEPETIPVPVTPSKTPKLKLPKPKTAAMFVKKTSTLKNGNITELPEKISKMLPALQSDIWKKLGMERKHCSKLMKVLSDNGLIKRTKEGGTYMIESVLNEPVTVKQKSFSALLSDSGKFSPCAGCFLDCNPRTCNLINSWISDIKV